MKRVLALILALATVLALAACGAQPAAPAAEPAAETQRTFTREELQKIVVETGFAYYDQNPNVQYDGRPSATDGTMRYTSMSSPEDASFDSMDYSVCSNYIFTVYYNAFHYRMMGSPSNTATKYMATVRADNPMLVYKYLGEGGETDIEKALADSRKLLQPGDVIVGYGTSGHAMLFVGDALGDGTEYCLHCWGSSYDETTGEDPIEPNGSIVLQPVDELCYATGKSPNWYLGKKEHSSQGFTILRPLDAADFEPQPMPWAVSRLDHSRIKITRELDRNKYLNVLNGEEIPVTLTITNNGTADYTALPVTEHLPEGRVPVEGSVTAGATQDGSTLSWTVDVPAGTSVALTYKVRLEGALGETIVFPSGSVADIPTRETSLTIGGKGLTEEQAQKLLAFARDNEGKKFEEFLDLDFFNVLYREALGVELGLPKTAETFTMEVLQRVKTPADILMFSRHETPAAGYETADKMILPLHVAGKYADSKVDPTKRVREFRKEYYQPGDLFFGTYGMNLTNFLDDGSIDYFVYLGSGNVLCYNKAEGVFVRKFGASIARSLKYNLLVGLRPAQAFEQIG